MSQSDRTLQDTLTSLSPAEVLAAAKHFFARRNPIYAAFVDMEGPGWVTLRGQGGEEIAIAAVPHEGATRVTASTYMFDQQVARFLSTLPPYGVHIPTELPGAGDATAIGGSPEAQA